MVKRVLIGIKDLFLVVDNTLIGIKGLFSVVKNVLIGITLLFSIVEKGLIRIKALFYLVSERNGFLYLKQIFLMKESPGKKEFSRLKKASKSSLKDLENLTYLDI